MSAKVDEATKQSDGKTASSFGDEPAILHVDNASENPIVDDDVPGAEAPAGDTLAQTQSQDPKTTQRGFDRESHKKEGFQKSGNAPPSDVDNMPNHPLTRDIRLIMQGTDEDLKDFYRSEMRSMLDDGIQSDGRTNTSRLNDEPQGRPMRRSNTEWVDVRTRGYGDTETEADSMTTGSSLPPRNFRERARKEQEKSRSKRARYRGVSDFLPRQSSIGECGLRVSLTNLACRKIWIPRWPRPFPRSTRISQSTSFVGERRSRARTTSPVRGEPAVAT